MVLSPSSAGANSLPGGIPAALQQAIQQLVTTLAPTRVYLFGSQARGTAGPDSDYDLMVVVPPFTAAAALPGFKRDRLAYRALRNMPFAKDVMVWTEREFAGRLHLPASLPATVVREGLVIYDRPMSVA